MMDAVKAESFPSKDLSKRPVRSAEKKALEAQQMVLFAYVLRYVRETSFLLMF